jgi:hypothetical protein
MEYGRTLVRRPLERALDARTPASLPADKKPHQRPRIRAPKPGRTVATATIQLQEATGSGRYFSNLIRKVEHDLGGRGVLSAIQQELVRSFAGVCTILQAKHLEILLGEKTDEIDLTSYALLINSQIRLATRLGIKRVAREVPSLEQYLKSRNREVIDGTTAEVDGDE